ncbi:MAG TPA: hypothetical protein DCX06_05770 [Opitutae bacterium]|nr:hypothetical protein [Opitutae bacterium]
MKSLSLILRIVAIVAAVAAAGIYFAAQGKLAEKQTELEAAQSARQAVQAELETANNQVTSLESRVSEEREALAKAKRDLESMRSEMYTARQEVTRTQQQLNEAKNQIDGLNQTAKKLRSDLISSEQSLASASNEGELARLTERVKELESTNSTLKSDLEAERSASSARAATSSATGSTVGGTSTYSINTNAPAVQPASIGTSTTIASVSPENGLIVLNGASELGLTPGTEITLIQDLKALGKVQVIAIQDDLAVANILPGAKTRSMVAGATVNLLR